MPGIELIAHRGAPRERPENTLASFECALAHGADGIELDVHFSSDAVPVVHHDAALGGAAGRYAGAELSSLAAVVIASVEVAPGARVPLLRDVAALVGARATLYVEIKAVAGAREIAAVDTAISASGGGPTLRYALHSFDHRVAWRAANVIPRVPTGILSESYLVDTVGALRAARARDLWQHWSQVDDVLVADVHAAGGRVVVWTVNDAARARRLAALGVDALCTDDVPLLRAALSPPDAVGRGSTRGNAPP